MTDTYPSKNVKLDESAKRQLNDLVAKLATDYPHLRVTDYAVAGALISAGAQSPTVIIAALVESYWGERKP